MEVFFFHVFDSEGFGQEIIAARDVGLGDVGAVSRTSKPIFCFDIGSLWRIVMSKFKGEYDENSDTCSIGSDDDDGFSIRGRGYG
jgi:hypothetical protein